MNLRLVTAGVAITVAVAAVLALVPRERELEREREAPVVTPFVADAETMTTPASPASPTPEAVAPAVEAVEDRMARAFMDDPALLDVLEDATTDPDPEVRREAEEYLRSSVTPPP
jgi:hypothetical protein